MSYRNIKYTVLIFLSALVTMASCKKNYYHDGGVSTGVLNLSIYDFLKSRPFEFDTVVTILDRAGLAAVLQNEKDITFLAPKDASVLDFIIQYNGDKLDQIPVDTLRKYMAKYIFKSKFMRDDITPDLFCNNYSTCDWVGDFKDSYDNYKMAFNLQPTAYNGVPNAGPRFIRLYDPRQKIYSQKDSVSLYWSGAANVVTSNLQATNGIVHVLGSHRFGFYKR